MNNKKFSISEAIKFGWETMKNNLRFFVILLTVAFLIENLPAILGNYVRETLPFVSSMLYLASWILGFIVQMGLIKVSLKFCEGTKAELDDLLSSFNLLLTFITGSVIYFMIILAGLIPAIVWGVKFNLFAPETAAVPSLHSVIVWSVLILLTVPAIIWAIKFSFYSYFIIDKGHRPMEAITASGKATEGAKRDLFLFGLVAGLINLAGILFFLVGLFATFSTTIVAYAYVYRKLAGQDSKNDQYINMGI